MSWNVMALMWPMKKTICDILNDHFCTVGTKIASMQCKIGNLMS